MLRNCIFARHSVATRHINIFTEKPPEATLETVNAVEVATGAAARATDSAWEMSASEVTHLFEVWSGKCVAGQTRKQ